MVPEVYKEKAPNPLSLMAIFHPLLKIKRKKALLHSSAVLILAHLQTPLTRTAKATGCVKSWCCPSPPRIVDGVHSTAAASNRGLSVSLTNEDRARVPHSYKEIGKAPTTWSSN